MPKGKPKQPRPLTAISAVEFRNRFSLSIREQGQRFTWFLGAGCSVSSGIPAAAGLVERWLGELHSIQGSKRQSVEEWAKDVFPDYDPNNLSRLYAKVFERRHPSPMERQREIEMICAQGEPSYGYATFAQMLSLTAIGERCNTILTTNFDDLIADALYVYGERHARPQIITHEALARYAKITSPRPTIVKLHGDAHIEPKNLAPETLRIESGVSQHIYPYLQDSALVFIGYGGNDESIFSFFKECPLPALAPPIYWVGKHDPAPAFAEWLSSRNALRVDHSDFDRLMHHLRGALQIDHPESARWERNYKIYFQQYHLFEEELKKEPESEEKAALRQATKETRSSLPTEWDYYIEATTADTPDEQNAAYLRGLQSLPDSALLTGMYAVFLKNVRNDMDGAEAYYKRAIEADPEDANNLGNYALFLQNIRKDMDGAETHYKRAIEADPKDANVLVNYATFLNNDRKDRSGADAYFKRALEADPKDANVLGLYAVFLKNAYKNMEIAETYYKRALDAGPKDVNCLTRYAVFLKNIRKDMDGAEMYFKRGLEIDPGNANNLGNYAQLLLSQGRDAEGLAVLYQALATATEPSLLTELQFYRLAHDPAHREQALLELRKLIADGTRSVYWDFSANIDRAKQNGFNEIELLNDLAKVISDDAPSSILDAHKLWRANS